MNNEQIVTRSIEAANVIDNPAFKEAIDSIKSEIINEWKRCPVRDKEGQAILLQLIKIADKFEGMLIGMIEGGKLAQHKIDIDSVRDENVIRKWARKIA